MSNTSTPLILLPGLDGLSLLARPFLQQLPPTVEPLCLDFPGDDYLDQQQLRTWASSRLRGVTGSFVLGQSWTTALAQELAHDLGARGLILITPLGQRRLRPGFAVALRQLPGWLLGLPPPRLATRWFLLGWDAPRALLDDFREAIRRVRGSVFAQRLREFGQHCARPFPPLPNCPTLCLHAGQDRLLAGSCPSRDEGLVQHRVLPGPHLLLPRHPESVAAEVLRFVAEVGS